MPKALFFNVPAHGHVNPSLPLVTELARRGHHITYFASEHYRARVEAAGAVFQRYATVPDDYFESRGLSGAVPQKVALDLLTTAGEILPELLETARGLQPDYVIFDGMCPWGHLVARILKVPAVVSLSLMALASTPLKALMNRDMLGAVMAMLGHDFGKGLEANRRSRALGKKYHVPPLGPTALLSAPGDLAISYTSSYFQPYASTVSDTVRFVGWTVNASADSFSFEPVRGRPLIYVSLGTVNNDDAAFFRTCIEAFTGSDYFVMITTGNRLTPESFGTLPENISIYSWVPQAAVLKRAALFISHAGLNSVHDSLYLGVPLLLVPQQGEQTMTSLRVVELGAGLMLKKRQVSAQSIRENAARLLTDARFKTEAGRIGDTFRTAGGMRRAADEIEALLLNGKP
jgi:MGT family glycosyltransferase